MDHVPLIFSRYGKISRVYEAFTFNIFQSKKALQQSYLLGHRYVATTSDVPLDFTIILIVSKRQTDCSCREPHRVPMSEKCHEIERNASPVFRGNTNTMDFTPYILVNIFAKHQSLIECLQPKQVYRV